MQPRLAIRKDPARVLAVHSGHTYEPSDATLLHIKTFLLDRYAVPDDLALQVLTHKSFAAGMKPYNEKLSTLGSKLANLFLGKYVLEHRTHNDTAVAGMNLDVLGTPMAKELAGRMALGVFAKKRDLSRVMFWKSYNHLLSFEASGELKVSAQMVYAMIGAVAFVHGKAAAEAFVREKLLSGPDSIEHIAAEFLARS
ncbi:hypothetical protein METBIDRAFT_43439 [Metschnikowia bicuspidata var. bicuspidata NRRL YB-4993]|uniref:RNase III domain-containing protein n=1 Tax=Metschnikowia bicuspidata var. bicuspidata NRRL YB-4993 TaxID=869754 RepID=A0A1A0H9D5_9ASCO|nr:hypothetical protein METBIDRAFT_43439 [Metschnikowia bicuspidata var. bicuspidata NRRL YB-4993]OBA20631.1 hypothetical protein METBIDRAFT_43439 [Metschnikowia bicuspidata var. bicuspidata NRRL YB-4993]